MQLLSMQSSPLLRAVMVLLTLVMWACSDTEVAGPEDLTRVLAKGGNGKGGGPPGGGDDGGGDGGTTYPVVQGVELPGAASFAGTPHVYQAAGGLVTGRDDDCGFVYEIATATKTCLSVLDADPARIYPQGLNAMGRIAGPAISAVTGESFVFVMDYPDDPAVELDLPSGWTGATVWSYAVNESGQIFGRISRPHPDPPKKDPNLEQRALILWPSDLGTPAVSAVFETGLFPEGVSDGGIGVTNIDGPAAWDGLHGTAPTPLDQAGFRWASLDGITAGGLIYGSSRGTTLIWPDRTAAAQQLVDLGARGTWHDRAGNLLVTGDAGTYCVDPSDGSVTELAPVAGYDYAVARDGTGAMIYGYSAIESQEIFDPRVLTVWEMPSGGC